MDKERKIIQSAIDHRLEAVEGNPFLAQRIIAAEEGEKEVKKVSASLVLALVLMVLTLSVGFALVGGGIIDTLWGGEENAPKDVAEQIIKPRETATTALGQVKVEEILFDGMNLHTTITVSNPTNETLLYTIDGVNLNNERIMGTNLLTDGAGYGGMLLGGQVEGKEMPQSYTFYNKGEYLLSYDENGKFLGYNNLPEGDLTLTVHLAVWRPLNAPRLIDYENYEGYNTTETRQTLVSDVRGLCELELFRPREAYRETTGRDMSSDIYADVYRDLGWAEKIDSVTLSVPVTLDKAAVPHGNPTQMTYQMGNLTIEFTTFDFTQAGGQATGIVTGDYNSVRNFLRRGVQLVDKATDRVFTGGLLWSSDGQDGEGVEFTLRFMPFSGDMPESAQLVPVIEYDDRWVPSSPAYDPAVAKPDNAVDCWLLDFDRAVTIEMNIP